MVFLRNAVAAGLLIIGGSAWAQSLSNGEPLQFNHEYRCNGERMIVGHCRDSNPGSYCMVYYPDRTPLHPGYQVQKAEQLGGVLARLNACSSSPSSASATTRQSEYVAAGTAPGLGEDSWQVLDFDNESATFFAADRIKRSGRSADGWFTLVYPKAQPLGAGMTPLWFLQSRFSADCTTNRYGLVEAAAFDRNGKMISDTAVPHPSFRSAPPGSLANAEVNVLCGRPQPLAAKGFDGGADFMLSFTAAASSAPGLGRANWRVLGLTDTSATFFTGEGIRRSGASADGWFTTTYLQPRDFGAKISNARFTQSGLSADCANKTASLFANAWYDSNGELISAGENPGQVYQVRANTQLGAMWNVLCGRPQSLAAAAPVPGAASALLDFTIEHLRAAALGAAH